jgi:hypothetical protein
MAATQMPSCAASARTMARATVPHEGASFFFASFFAAGVGGCLARSIRGLSGQEAQLLTQAAFDLF